MSEWMQVSALWTSIGWARCAAGLLLCLQGIALCACCAPTGAWRAVGLCIDDSERAALRAAALCLSAVGVGLCCAVCRWFGMPWPLMLLASLLCLLTLLISLRFRLRLGRFGWAEVFRLARSLTERTLAALLYGVPMGIYAYAVEPLAAPGYALGLLVLCVLRLDVGEGDVQARRRGSWAVLLAALCACACGVIAPRFGQAALLGAALPTCALLTGCLLSGRMKTLPLLLFLGCMAALPPLVPTPFARLGVLICLALLLVCMRRDLYEAVLPLRALLIRMRARVR